MKDNTEHLILKLMKGRQRGYWPLRHGAADFVQSKRMAQQGPDKGAMVNNCKSSVNPLSCSVQLAPAATRAKCENGFEVLGGERPRHPRNGSDVASVTTWREGVVSFECSSPTL